VPFQQPTPKIGFGVVGPNIVATRPPRQATPRTNEYQEHFPVGVFVDIGATWTDSAGTTYQSNQVAGWQKLLAGAPGLMQGLRELNLPYMLCANGSPYFHEAQQDIPGVTDADPKGAWQVFAPYTRRTATVGTGLDVEFMDATGVANTRSNVDPLVATIVAQFTDHPSVLAYNLHDDVTEANGGPKARTAIQSFQAQDPLRPASAVIRDNAVLTPLTADAKLLFTYEYATGYYNDGTPTAEGDFHRNTFASDGSVDWVDVIRTRLSTLPSGARAWWILHTHKTTSGALNTQVRYPTVREMRKQFWIAVGEGIKGLFWFLWTDQLPASEGLGSPGRAAERAVAKELSDRLTPGIRAQLLRCARVSDAFATSGGGSTGYRFNYANAYVSTLYDAGSDVYYCVVCNHGTSAATVTINSATLSGTLTNLETGAVIRVGESVTLPALDGTIFQHDPAYGVPVKAQDLSTDVQTWWGDHWANPAAGKYLDAADVRTWPNEVIVAPGELQAAIDASPDRTTFRLQAGTHPRVEIIGRSHLAFVADNPAARPTLVGIDYFGCAQAKHYQGTTNDATYGYGYVTRIRGTAAQFDQLAYDTFLDPPGDLIFRGLDFVSDGNAVVYQTYFYDGAWKTNHRYVYAAIGLRTVRNVLIEDCTFTGYKAASAQTGPPTEPPPQSGAPDSHPGIIWGNAGIESVIVRGCTFTAALNAANFGFPYAVFFDGARGCILEGNTIQGIKWHSGQFLFLCNDDYTHPYGRGNVPSRDGGSHDPRFCVVANNTAAIPTGQSNFTSFAGFQNLVTGNTLTLSNLALGVVMSVVPKCSRLHFEGHVYEAADNVCAGNTVIGVTTCPQFVSVDDTQGYNCVGNSDPTNVYRSRAGRTVVTNNSAPGATVTTWLSNTGTTISGDVVSGNTV
jgi:hypothetical protein